MRKILVILVLLISLSACGTDSVSNALKDKGYSDEDISFISNLSEDILSIIENSDYDTNIVSLIQNEDFIEANLEEYLKIKDLSNEDRILVVNNGYYTDTYDEVTLALMRTDYYIHSRLSRYKDYMESHDYSDYREVVEYVNCNRDYDYYTNTLVSDTSLGDLMIANKYYSIEEYEPEDLVNIDSYYGLDAYIDRDTYEAYKRMVDDMVNEGLYVWITSAYRPYSSQLRIYNSYLDRDPQHIVDTYSARPGYSDHQTGRVVDVIVPGGDLGSFEYTEECEWMHANAYKYGFILRYPSDKTDLTGYMYESWHFRYVGEEVSNYIHDTGITFDEYYAYFIEG